MSIFTKKGSLNFKDYVWLVTRRWKIMAITFAVCVIAAIYANIFTQPLYLATATLVVSPDLPQAVLGSINSYVTEINESLSIETHLLILRSDPVAEGVVRRLHLIDEEKDPVAFQEFVKKVKLLIWVERVPKARLFKIKAYWHKGVEAADLANATAEVFIEQTLQNKFEASKRSISWLTEQIIETRRKLEDSERELVEYQRRENLGKGGVTDALQLKRISEAQSQFINAQTRNQVIKTRISQLNKLIKEKRIRFVPTDLSSSLGGLASELTKVELELEKAKLVYKTKHPKIIRLDEEIEIIEDQIRSEIKKVIESLDSEYQVNLARNKILDNSLDSLNQMAFETNEKQIQYAILTREVETYKELYNVLIRKLKAMDLTLGIGESNIRIIEHAKTPPSPIRPRKKRNLIFGILVGLVASLGFAFFLEYFDRTIHTPDDLEDMFDYPILVSIPKVREKSKDFETQTLFLSKTRQQSGEAMAFQTLRTALRFSQTSDSPHTYLITSTSPSEGKTTISVNLGISISNSGSKTLVVDTDLRRPKIHTIFQKPNDRGVSNCDENHLEKYVQKTEFENLDIMTSGPHIGSIFELLESKKMQRVVNVMKSKYEYILFDSPPVGSVADASVLSTYVDGVIFVLRSGKIESIHLKHAKEQLEKVNAHIFGVVLNKLDQRASKYYYNYYYYYGGYYGDRAKDILQGIKDSVRGL